MLKTYTKNVGVVIQKIEFANTTERFLVFILSTYYKVNCLTAFHEESIHLIFLLFLSA